MMIKVFQIVAIVISAFCVSSMALFKEPLWLLPLLYSILITLSSGNKKLIKGSPGMIALNITMFCRYVLAILACYLNGELSRYTINYTYVKDAIYLMAYEMIVVFVVIEFCGKKFKNKPARVKESIQSLEIGLPLLILFLIIQFFIGITYMHLSQGFDVFVGGSYDEFYDIKSAVSQGTHYVEIIWETLWVWIYIYLVLWQKRLYDKTRSCIHVYVCLLFTLLILLITFIGQTAINRWYTIMTACSSLALLVKLYPNEKKSVLTIILAPVGAVIFLATIIKNAGYVAGSTTISESLIVLFNPSEMDSYFCGPVGLGSAIDVYHRNIVGFSNLFNDVLSSAPFIGRTFPSTQTTAYAYWNFNGRGDLIIPLLGQSAIYFGFILSPLLTALSVVISRKFDALYKNSMSYMTYIYAFAAIWFAIESMALNLTINSNWFFIRIMPFMLILWVTCKMSNKKHAL